ncbi:multidrug effflux MFS transporter [Actinoplanes sp. NBRC 103695]|uniref:multidrug effflux MFS transporter n=1 Tax=Actinoplanes sp. NBRC 103695 TaxID=3032202 RepID=UPI0025528F88|nr:multidrug effflux MFS transporter [Actinoplanes sp. NBRC 103695]
MRSSRHGGALLVVLLGLMTAFGPLSLDMYLPAFPEIGADLGVPPAQVQLSLTTCLLGLAAGQLIFGPVSDRLGRRPVAIFGMTAYAVASTAIALAPSAPTLIGLRFVQGLAGGIGIVVARAIVRDLHSGVAAAKYFSRLTLILGLAPIAAPALGSVVLRLTSWHGIFVTLGLFGALLAGLVVTLLPETLADDRRSTGGLGDLLATARTLFADRIFLGYAVAQGMSLAALFAYISGSSFVLQDGYGLTPTTFAVLFGVNACGLLALSQVNGWLLNRFAPRPLLVATMIAQVGAGVIAVVAAVAGLLPLLAVGFFALVSTIGMVSPNATALALDRHPERAGTAAALLGGLQMTIAALITPLVGALGDPGRGLPTSAVILSASAISLAAVVTLTSAEGGGSGHGIAHR